MMLSKPSNEVILIERCLKQQASAQKELYELYFNYAMSVALRYCQNRDEAIEVVNDAFMRALNSLSQFDPQQLFKPWFRRIVVNTAIDHYRKNKTYFVQDTESHIDEGVEPEVFTQFSTSDIMHCVQQLPPSYRVVFVLYAVEGYKHHEIADMLKISEGTSKSNLAMARNKLQGMLTGMSKIIHPHYAG